MSATPGSANAGPLTNLQSLNLSNCKQLRDLQPLAALTSLQSLNLSNCQQLQNLQPLAAFTRLESLDLSDCGRLQNLQPLAALTNLQSLNVSFCKQLRDLQPLTVIRSIREVYLMGVKIDSNPGASPLASWIRLGQLYADQLIAAPNELGSEDDYIDNALPRVRAWQDDLLAGEASDSTIKFSSLVTAASAKPRSAVVFRAKALTALFRRPTALTSNNTNSFQHPAINPQFRLVSGTSGVKVSTTVLTASF